MALKDLTVHLDPGARTATRLEVAVSLARNHAARLTGLFGQRALADQVGVVVRWPSDEYIEAANASKAAFERATTGLARAEWHDINRGSDHEVLRHITDSARYADIVLLGQHDDARPAHVPPELVEEVIVNGGRPVLVVPYAGDFAHVGRRALIAWNSTRESARALNDALPLIAACDECTVVSLEAPYDLAVANCAEVAQHLACHGILAKTEVLMSDDVHVMDLLLNRVSDLSADLLVIGAHGQSGFPRAHHGPGARNIVRQMVVPTLISG
jgi:nucleotide-binding universal stress UspA family protein